MGDVNAKHTDFNCNPTKRSRRALRGILDSTNLTIINNHKPTHIHSSTSTADILDLVLCSRIWMPNSSASPSAMTSEVTTFPSFPPFYFNYNKIANWEN